VNRVGGIPSILKSVMMSSNAPFRDDLITVGESLKSIIANAPNPDEDVIRSGENVFSKEGGLVIMRGNIAPDSGVVKVAGVDEDMKISKAKRNVLIPKIVLLNRF
jgi:dihydroxy-acid dehydratase